MAEGTVLSNTRHRQHRHDRPDSPTTMRPRRRTSSTEADLASPRKADPSRRPPVRPDATRSRSPTTARPTTPGLHRHRHADADLTFVSGAAADSAVRASTVTCSTRRPDRRRRREPRRSSSWSTRSVADGTDLSRTPPPVASDGTSRPEYAATTPTPRRPTVIARADLSITKTDSPDPVIAGNNLTYTITVTTPARPTPSTSPSATSSRPARASSRPPAAATYDAAPTRSPGTSAPSPRPTRPTS